MKCGIVCFLRGAYVPHSLFYVAIPPFLLLSLTYSVMCFIVLLLFALTGLEVFMGTSIDSYANSVVKTLKNVARDNAIRDGSNDEGFTVQITKSDIKQGTDRSRIKAPLMNSIVDVMNSSGLEAEEGEGTITVFVPPVLGKKDVFTLDEIIERERVVEDINTIETYKLQNE